MLQHPGYEREGQCRVPMSNGVEEGAHGLVAAHTDDLGDGVLVDAPIPAIRRQFVELDRELPEIRSDRVLQERDGLRRDARAEVSFGSSDDPLGKLAAGGW